MHTMSHANNHSTSAGNDTTIVERVANAADTSTTVTIVRAVAEAESVTPGELPVLAEVIDPESIEGLFDADSAVGRSGVRLSFDYCGYVVEVTDDLVTLSR